VCDTVSIHAASQEQTLVIASRNEICLVSLDLELRGVLQADFEPLAMSLDEAGRIYLIVKDKDGMAFWLLTPQGERLMAYRFEAGAQPPLVPPAIGFDHCVYLVGDHCVIAIDNYGQLLWTHPISAEVAWLSVTADDQLLLADGTELARIDPDGARHSLYRFGEVLHTPPLLTPDGRLIVASRRHLFLLTPA
jgi:hypothetical protein